MDWKSKCTAAAFLLALFGFAIGQFLLPDQLISSAERRKLAQVPDWTVSSVMDGSYGDDLEIYLLDQFPLRDALRRLKALWQFDVYRQKDNNGIYLADGSVCKLDRELKPAQVNALIQNTNKVYETYLQGMNVYFALIPDKNYFAARSNGYPSMDYGDMDQRLREGLDGNIRYYGMTPFSGLKLEDYYTTDLHWRQECLESVLQSLGASMDFVMPDFDGFVQTEYAPFYGAYYGQSALNVPPDTLVTLSGPAIDAAVVTGIEFAEEKAVYDAGDFDHPDLYDVYLGGAQAIVTVTNPNGTAGKDLILFRDSFASSLAPLLLDSYDTITLIDLRYVSADLVGNYVEFTDQDVLFLYNTALVNAGMLLK